ncbi:MAG: hypothetical protein ACI88A_004500 [Paraglaciecola sp.]|jgi:hypothetical protein
MKIKMYILGLTISLLSFTTSASIIFDFTISDLSGFSINRDTNIGDTFSITFFDDSNFISGITEEDVEAVSFDTAHLGEEFVTPVFNPLNDYSKLDRIFNFSMINPSTWQLDLLVGVTGLDYGVQFTPSLNGNVGLQLGQTANGSGSTNFVLTNSNDDKQSLHDFDVANTFTSTAPTAVVVSEPTVMVLIFLGVAGMGISRKKY